MIILNTYHPLKIISHQKMNMIIKKMINQKITIKDHGVSGKVYSCGNNQLVFENFKFDGLGPDATFWVGMEGNEPSVDGILLTYPFEGKFYDPEDFSAPVLNKAFDGTQGDIVLPLPNDVKVSDLKWISIWSREYLLNFGDFIFKDDQMEEESEFEGGLKGGTVSPKPENKP